MIFGPIGSLAIGAVKSIGNTSPPPEYVVPVGSKLVIGATSVTTLRIAGYIQ